MVTVSAHIAGVPVEEWLPFVAPVVALYLYGRHRDRRRGEAVKQLADSGRSLDAGTVRLVLGEWASADHKQLGAEHLPLFYPPGPDGLTIAELSAHSGCEQPTVEQMLDGLEELGYVELDEQGSDGERRTWLTVAGYDALLVAENALLGAASARAAGAAES